jgi:hypothetical protein
MRKYLLMIVIAMSSIYLHGLLEKFDFMVSGGFTSSNVTGKTVKQTRYLDFAPTPGIQYGASAIYSDYKAVIIEGGVRYLEKGYELYRGYNHHHYHHYTRYRHKYFYDQMKSSYLDAFVKFKPLISSSLEMDDLNVALKPFLGYAFSYLLESDDRNVNSTDSSILLGCDVIYNKRFVLGLEYNKGIKNVFYEGRADHESFNITLGIIF